MFHAEIETRSANSRGLAVELAERLVPSIQPAPCRGAEPLTKTKKTKKQTRL